MILYSLAYTIKMSKKGSHQIKDYFDFVVPPLEGFWWQDGVKDIDYAHKEADTIYGKIGVKVWIYKGEILPAKGNKGGKENANTKEN